jgi:uncharacterized protein YydD (DUF2326 family)
MNPYATENPLHYDLRKCNEAIEQTKAQRTELQDLLKQALIENATPWIGPVKEKLKELRIRLNQLCARRSALRKKLNTAQHSGSLLMQTIQ